MCQILGLPVELLEHIFTDKCLSFHDICNIARTCSTFRNVCSSNEIWKCQINQRWPKLYRYYDSDQHYGWQEEYQLQLQYIHQVKELLNQVSKFCHQKTNLSDEDFQNIIDILEKHERASWFVVNAVNDMLQDGDSSRNLTQKYYGELALSILQHHILAKKWKQFLDEMQNEQSLLKGAVLVAQWFQPSEDITYTQISEQLNSIAQQVVTVLQTRHPKHPLVARSQSCSSETSYPVLASGDSRHVLETLNFVMFEKLGFSGNEEDYYNSDNSYINKVLETKAGIPISLSLLYCCVAQTLGVTCSMVNFPGHVLLKWREHPELKDASLQYTYIDSYRQGQFLSQKECPTVGFSTRLQSNDPSFFEPCRYIDVFLRFVRNLIRIGRTHSQSSHSTKGLFFLLQALELYYLLKPDDLDNCVLLVRLYLHLEINQTKADAVLDSLLNWTQPIPNSVQHLRDLLAEQREEMIHFSQTNTPPQIVPKKRSLKEAELGPLKYSVGMIMQHRQYNYLCVISGWDHRCTATRDWIHQMGVHSLPKKESQPFYNVLVEDSSNRYAAEENLQPAPEPTPIPHPEVGKHFDEFCDTHYRLNSESSRHYPEDLQCTQEKCQQGTSSMDSLD